MLSLMVPQSVWSAVFRTLVQQLRGDPVFKRVAGAGLRSWEGVPADKAPFAPTAGQPVVRLTPYPQAVDWYGPGSQVGTLQVKVEFALVSLRIDDVLDFWDQVLIPALSPSQPYVGTTTPLSQALVAAGAETGEIVFSDPTIDHQPDAQPEGQFFASGSFRLQVIRTFTP